MVSTERMGESLTNQSPPEFTHFMFANPCREIVEDKGPLTLDQKSSFVKNFSRLTGNKSAYNGSTFLYGHINGYDSHKKIWEISSSLQEGASNQHINFIDKDYIRTIQMDEEGKTTMKFTPNEEGIWAWDETLSDEEARAWMGKALEVYDLKLSEENRLRYIRRASHSYLPRHFERKR